MSSTSVSASVWKQSLVHVVQQLQRAGATPRTIERTIARLKGRRKRRRLAVEIANRAQTQFGLILGDCWVDALLVDPTRN